MFRNRLFVLLLLFVSCNIATQAQVWAMILEGLISAAEEYSYQMDLDAQIEKEVKASVEKLNSIDLGKTELNKVGKSYSAKAKSSSKMDEEMSELVHSYIYNMARVKLTEVANGSIEETSIRYQDSLVHALSVSSLEDVLSAQVLDSLNAMGYENLIGILLNDIKNEKKIAYALNSNPKALRIYVNSLGSDLRRSPAHLLYWSANGIYEHVTSIPRNTQLINPFDVSFRDNKLYWRDNDIATTDGSRLLINDINLLNLYPQSKAIYMYGNTKYYTDAIGRVIKVEQTITQDDKGKCGQRANLKLKNFKSQKATEEQLLEYHIGLIDYKAPICFINTTYIENSKENKNAIKTIKKEVKSLFKLHNNIRVTTVLDYSRGTQHCSSLTISVNGRNIATIENKTS